MDEESMNSALHMGALLYKSVINCRITMVYMFIIHVVIVVVIPAKEMHLNKLSYELTTSSGVSLAICRNRNITAQYHRQPEKWTHTCMCEKENESERKR